MEVESVVQFWHDYRILLLTIAVAVTFCASYLSSRTRAQPIHDAKEFQIEAPTGTFSQKRDAQDSLRNTPKTNTLLPAKPSSRAPPKRIVGRKSTKPSPPPTASLPIQPLIFFSSLSGSTESSASEFLKELSASVAESNQALREIYKPLLHDLSYLEYDDYFTTLPKPADSDTPVQYFYIILVPTYNIDTILNNFLEHLKEVHHDFRIDTAPLQRILGYAVFGFGDKEGWPTEDDGFCSQAKEVDKWMAKLTNRKRAYPLGMGDVKSDAEARLTDWRKGVEDVLINLQAGNSLGEGVPGSGDALESDEEDEDVPLKSSAKPAVADLESLGLSVSSGSDTAPRALPLPIDFTTTKTSTTQTTNSEAREMVPITSPTYASLTKQGYSIIGSHSGVKICRWTKSALRGRGSCYKYSFYGIASHLCMETTPSLSCSNKCVFCWRHGTNPVGTTWRWKVDPPELIFDGVKKAHYQKIKSLRGVPGVRAERFEEAMRIRHCALSLVGEPIFYPHINEFVGMLHAERISSFLVCNAQHPDQLAALRTVTQLYVSIDASNRDSLRKIDRPLHRDFWERFCRCLDIIASKRFVQRTVFRLTLVKGFNIEDEAEGYADLVQRGLPCLVEVKGVTYCGTSTSKGAGLTMQNVPFYEEVCAFVVALNEALARRGLGYGIAAEHAHSCCILLASDRFRGEKEGTWNTTIDYARFFSLLESGEPFTPEDYMAPTPEWALWGNGGFDPRDERVRRKGKNKDKETIE